MQLFVVVVVVCFFPKSMACFGFIVESCHENRSI